MDLECQHNHVYMVHGSSACEMHKYFSALQRMLMIHAS